MTALWIGWALAGGDAAVDPSQAPVFRAPPSAKELRQDGVVASGDPGIFWGVDGAADHRAAVVPVVLTVDATPPPRHPQAAPLSGGSLDAQVSAPDPAVVHALRERVEAAWTAHVATWEHTLVPLAPGVTGSLEVDGQLPADPRWFALFNQRNDLDASWYLAIHVGLCPSDDGPVACVRGPDHGFGGGESSVVAMRFGEPVVRGRTVRTRRVSTIERTWALVERPGGAAFDHPILGVGQDFAAQAEDAALEAIRRIAQAWNNHRGRYGPRP